MRKLTSTNAINEQRIEQYCNAHKTLSLFSGRWKISILFLLEDAPLSYGELKAGLPDISDRMLAKQLRDLTNTGLLLRSKHGIASHYSVTPKGSNIYGILKALRSFEH